MRWVLVGMLLGALATLHPVSAQTAEGTAAGESESLEELISHYAAAPERERALILRQVAQVDSPRAVGFQVGGTGGRTPRRALPSPPPTGLGVSSGGFRRPVGPGLDRGASRPAVSTARHHQVSLFVMERPPQ